MDFKRNFIIGLLAAYVPLYLMSYQFANDCYREDIHYPSLVRSIPVAFALLNVILIPLLNYMGIDNWFAIGAIFSVIYSVMGRFISGIPRKVFEMKDENYFHIYAFIIWTVFYGFFIRYII